MAEQILDSQRSSGTIRMERSGEAVRLVVDGPWTIADGRRLEERVKASVGAAGAAKSAVIALGEVDRLDTAGAWLLTRLGRDLAAKGIAVEFAEVDEGHKILLDAAREAVDGSYRPRQSQGTLIGYVDRLGANMIQIGEDFVRGVIFLGAAVTSLGTWVSRPWAGRWISVVHQMDRTGVQAIPIIALMSLLIGATICQQSIFQLRQFGADALAVDLVAILVLREIGVLLTAIMVAGRSGSAFTAEIGSMKMREEVDAMRVIGLEPVEVLVLPRVVALIVTLPLLTFVSDIAGLFGAGLVSWSYAGMPPATFIERVREAIGLNTYLVGLIKAPAMALIIGLISTVEGLAVKGSAESLGIHTTAAVVKSIFMVIVVDGLFAIFFASIGY